MPKTFRKKSNKQIRNTKKTEKVSCKFPAATAGLMKWYVNLYEKLGWMVLAKHQGMVLAMDFYKRAITVLKERIICKIDSVRDYDKRNDLRVVLDNVIVLEKYVEANFN
jgi:hypothetical protein